MQYSGEFDQAPVVCGVKCNSSVRLTGGWRRSPRADPIASECALNIGTNTPMGALGPLPYGCGPLAEVTALPIHLS